MKNGGAASLDGIWPTRRRKKNSSLHRFPAFDFFQLLLLGIIIVIGKQIEMHLHTLSLSFGFSGVHTSSRFLKVIFHMFIFVEFHHFFVVFFSVCFSFLSCMKNMKHLLIFSVCVSLLLSRLPTLYTHS